jgi:uncharacterized YccA/Bax inhibitor family protein
MQALRGERSPFAKAMMKAANPLHGGVLVPRTDVMTVQGTVNKTSVLLGVLVASAVGAWRLLDASAGAFPVLVLTGIVGGLVTALITTANPRSAPATAPVYALLEGLVLGGLSWVTATELGEGAVILAVGGTVATLAAMLMAYRTGLIRPTEKLRRFLLVAMLGILLTYVSTFVLSLAGMDTSLLFGHGPLAVLGSLFVIGVAALSLILDLDFIERGAQAELDKHFEWYGAFGMVVTLVWIYLEILRLLAEIFGNDS